MISAHPEISEEIVEKIVERLEGMKKFVAENRESLREQKHLDEGSPERAYWHAGYASALTDILNLVSGTRKPSN
jgi:hypothetical protein